MKEDSFPRLENILSFLQSRGWTFARKNKLFIYLDPPKNIKLNKSFQYTLPATEKILDYKKFIWYTVNSLSEFYDLDFDFLYNLFSQKPEDYREVTGARETAVAA